MLFCLGLGRICLLGLRVWRVSGVVVKACNVGGIGLVGGLGVRLCFYNCRFDLEGTSFSTVFKYGGMYFVCFDSV